MRDSRTASEVEIIAIGDEFAITEVRGGIELKPLETGEMRALRRVMQENREVLKRLADG